MHATYLLHYARWPKIDRGVIFEAPEKWKYCSVFATRRSGLYNAPGRAIGQSLGLSGWSWPSLRLWQDGPTHKIDRRGHLWCTRKIKILILLHFYSMKLVQCAWEGDWVKFGFVRMVLADPTAVARQLGTPIFSKSCTWKTVCLDLTNGPQHLRGRGKHVVRSDLAKPVPYTFHTYPSFHVFTWNLSPCNHEMFAHGLHMVHAWFARILWTIASLAPGRKYRALLV